MTDIATAPGSREPAESSGSTVIALVGVGILAVLLIMAATLPFDANGNPDAIPMLFGS